MRGLDVRWLVAMVAAASIVSLTGPAVAGTRYLDPIFDLQRTNDLVYGAAFNSRTNSVQELLLDLYEPASDPSAARPAVVWIHGGSFTSGTRTSASMVYQAAEYAKRGWVAVSIEYRLLQPGGSLQDNGNLYFQSWLGRSAAIDAAQHDAQAAVRWLRANASIYRIDPDRIAVGGASAGAITALQVLYNPEDPGDSGNPDEPSDVGAAISISGFAVVKDMEPFSPPALMFHGTNDTTVPFLLHEYTCGAAIALASGCEQTIYPGAGHVPTQYQDDWVARGANFLCRTVLSGICEAPAPPPVQVYGVDPADDLGSP